VLRRAVLLSLFALLGFGGVASAKLVTDPATTTTTTEELATGPTGVGVTTPGATTTTAAATTTVPFTTSTVATVTAPVTTTHPATTTHPVSTTTASTTTTTAAPSIATSAASSTLVIDGHGWGHGVGMSQWGADGYALHGWSYRQILVHYYQGTTIGTEPDPPIRVLLAGGRTRVTIASDSPWSVTDAQGTTLSLPAGPLVVPADLVVSGHTLVSPLTFTPGSTPLRVGKAPYRGSFLIVSNGTTLQLVNKLPLESYVLGVVGREMPASWPAAALEAQAVAARSYALAELEDVVTVRAFDVYSDTRSQVYGGIDAETASVAAAVAATSKQVVLYQGKVATTYFSSSSGGRTVSSAEAWGTAVPYLQSVPDPYDTLSPYHDWGPVLFNATKVARLLKVPGDLVGLDVTPGPSDHVATVDAVGTEGEVELTGSDVRAALGLRSTWFSVGLLALTAPTPPIAYGGGGLLTGIARGVGGAVSLEEKSPAGTWQQVSTVAPGADGTFSVAISPTATTQYRLAAGLVRAALVKVPVVPVVTATAAAGQVQGTVRPALAGAAVQIQREDGTGWTTVASGTTDVTGDFAVVADLVPGSYRVRCAPGHGLSPGVSTPILQS